ncbi:hypothetical protein Ocin01_14039 [Orchesella cincta]|uniref:Uncharacterized protein n=1 Tax=Orchesella cincta TaxID=48709 RepID=A0A1D2MIA5_ORCCI|nr:hypothetical protein Ocin01_14039 [Orchesella cincta]
MLFVFVTSSSQNGTPNLSSLHGNIQETPVNDSREADGVISGWIRGRRTKVLDKPLESQLNFQETDNQDKAKDHDNLSTQKVPTFSLLSGYSVKNGSFGLEAEKSDMQRTDNQPNKSITVEIDYNIPEAGVAGNQRQNKNVAMINSKTSQKRRLRTKGKQESLFNDGLKTHDFKALVKPDINTNYIAHGPIRRQEADVSLISLATEGPIELTSVSPIESSFGGLTGLQSLPPLSILQFIKLLVAVTPFMIPIIFIPLLILTIGIFMIPVTRSNIFLDVGDFRSFKGYTTSVWSPYMGSIKNFTTSVVMPRALQFANEVSDHESCVEKISCEISARYLHDGWNGSWRSIANRGWISRIMSVLWRNHPTVGRIARSLDVDGLNAEESKSNKTSRSITNDCSRYTCQPITFIRKYF